MRACARDTASARSIDEAAKAASEMIGKHLVTKQTTEDGVLVNKVLPPPRRIAVRRRCEARAR